MRESTREEEEKEEEIGTKYQGRQERERERERERKEEGDRLSCNRQTDRSRQEIGTDTRYGTLE